MMLAIAPETVDMEKAASELTVFFERLDRGEPVEDEA